MNNNKRLNVFVQKDTYKKLNDFVKHNRLITTKLTYSTIVEISLNLFFKETEKNTIENILIENLKK